MTAGSCMQLPSWSRGVDVAQCGYKLLTFPMQPVQPPNTASVSPTGALSFNLLPGVPVFCGGQLVGGGANLTCIDDSSSQPVCWQYITQG